MSVVETPLYKESTAYMAKLYREEIAPALARCRTDEQRDQCLAAYAHKQDVELDAICQRHGQPPALIRIRP